MRSYHIWQASANRPQEEEHNSEHFLFLLSEEIVSMPLPGPPLLWKHQRSYEMNYRDSCFLAENIPRSCCTYQPHAACGMRKRKRREKSFIQHQLIHFHFSEEIKFYSCWPFCQSQGVKKRPWYTPGRPHDEKTVKSLSDRRGNPRGLCSSSYKWLRKETGKEKGKRRWGKRKH